MHAVQRRLSRSRVRAFVVLGLVAPLLAHPLVAPPAEAAPGPVAQRSTSAPTADALPTAQVDGVVWSQAVVGNMVYAGGSFGTARPAGAAPGTSTVPRTHLMSYDITTGTMTTFAPVINAQVLALATSPDGSRLYVAGEFTKVNGLARNRIAAFDTATGALVATFAPPVNGKVKALYVTAGTVYAGGAFTRVGSATRTRLAAFRVADGGLLPWSPSADSNVNAITGSSDGRKIVVGGAFTTLSGGAAYGLGAVDPLAGTPLPWAASAVVRDAGPYSAVTSLVSSGDRIYGTGYVSRLPGGNLEGTFAAHASTGNIEWLEDCHGDSYSVALIGDQVYTVGHAHECTTAGGWPRGDKPWSYQRALAFTRAATGTLGTDPYGYHDFAGSPSPSLVNWFPDLSIGSVTGMNQGPWNVTGDSRYVVLGGEFPTVNGKPQQGLVRFALPAAAPRTQGPRLSGASFVPTVASWVRGSVRVAFHANWDRDDKPLTYQVVRDGNKAQPAFTTTADSTFWDLPGLGFVDSGLAPGTAHTYRLYASDQDGNTVSGSAVTVTVATTTGDPGDYARLVAADGASHYWRLGEAAGGASHDRIGYNDLTLGTGVARGVPGAVAGELASRFDGTDRGAAVDPVAVPAPDVFTEEAWFRTTSASGGKIVGFGDALTGGSSLYDRHVFMDAEGRVWFGVANGGAATVNTGPGFNDGRWHHVVASMNASGMTLSLDGTLVGTNSGGTFGWPYTGYWRIGGDSSWGGDAWFDGDIDEVAIYGKALTPSQVAAHFVAGISGQPAHPPVP